METVAEKSLLKKGAEASLFITNWHGLKVVVKARIPKRYRPPELDMQIRAYRTVHEPQLMHEAKSAGVPTPLVYMVNVPEASITMQYIEGQQIKQLLNGASKEQRRELCLATGELIAKLHKQSLIHGDLTTSNMILSPEGKIYFVDFGLGEKNSEVEAQGVDLHLMKRALQSTHYMFWEECFKNVLSGYSRVSGIENAEKVYEKIHEIERRGRYVEERKGNQPCTSNVKIVFFATGNINKFNEARSILSPYGFALALLRVKGDEIQSDNLNEIATAAATNAFKSTSLPIFVEDAGLFINTLDGFPGPYAAYAYKTIHNSGILRLMENVRDRQAKFQSVIAYVDELLCKPECFSGESNGEITQTERKTAGKSAFGFDPIFQPAGSSKSFAEMTIKEKNGFSHRGIALRKFAEWHKTARWSGGT